MNKKIINVLMFTAGAAIGSGVTWYIVKNKYERILQEEIDSVKETWAQLNQNGMEEDASEEVEIDDIEDEDDYDEDAFGTSDMIDYSQIASRYKTSGKKVEETDDTDNDKEGEGDAEVPYINGPYVIDPSDFGEFDHDCYGLTYYSDGVLANDWWETFDIDETIGLDALNHFGDVVEDIVHVRNERRQADYEVSRDPRRYADLVANDPLLTAHEN